MFPMKEWLSQGGFKFLRAHNHTVQTWTETNGCMFGRKAIQENAPVKWQFVSACVDHLIPCPKRPVLWTSVAPRYPSILHTTSPSFLSQTSSHTVPQRRSWKTSTRPSWGPDPFTSRTRVSSTATHTSTHKHNDQYMQIHIWIRIYTHLFLPFNVVSDSFYAFIGASMK